MTNTKIDTYPDARLDVAVSSPPSRSSHEAESVDDESQLRSALSMGSAALLHEVASPKPDYERLRRGVRGSDNALEAIGSAEDRRRLQDILLNAGDHSHDELLDAVFANYSGEAFGDEGWRKITGGWSTPEENTSYGEFRERYPHLAQLSLDPGFVTHLTDFIELAQQGELTTLDYQSTRQELKEKLGDVTVWRGMALTEEELEKVKQEGILSLLGREVNESGQPLAQFEASALTAWPSHAIESHFHNSHDTSPFISVSSSKELALTMGHQFGKLSDDRKLYLLKIKMPKIDLVDYTEHGVQMPGWLQQLLERNPDAHVPFTVDGEVHRTRWADGAEQFGYWKIDPEDIVEITQPQITESKWNGKTKRTPRVD